MKIEDQVCTLEQAKKLRELGVNASSIFHYCHEETAVDGEHYVAAMLFNPSDDSIPAYTVAELGEMLNKWHNTHQTDNALPEYYNDGIVDWWHCDKSPVPRITAGTEAIARASLLIYLLENNLITQQNQQR